MGKFDLQSGVPGFTVRGSSPLAIPVSTLIQQSLALIMGYTYSNAVPLRSSPSGILYTAEPRISDIFHWTAVGNDEDHQGEFKECTQVVVMGHPDNVGLIWARPFKGATDLNALPIKAAQGFTFSVENLSELHVRIATSGETAIIAYSL